jgi:D-alanyl-D-alanine carboxypeptidase (penicillin-binding protein 5/6)
MLRLLLTLVLILLVLTPAATSAQEVPELQINSQRYILIDAETGHVYAQKGARDEVAIASITKVFTAVQALEMASPDTLITTTEDDLFGPSHSLMGFGPGETYTLEDLIFGLMLPSGNDAAYAIARSLGQQPGDTPEEAVERFMGLLNQRMLDMGLVNTFLITPSGWGVPGHHSSAWDVATMMQHALQYPLIVEAISTLEYTTSNGMMYMRNNNRLLQSYDALLGGKTGYDLDSGWCLVEVAERDNRRMISVTLDGIAPDDWYDDNRVLLEYGFEQPSVSASWAGDVVRWQNPSIEQVLRSAEPDVRVGRGNALAVADPIPDTSADLVSAPTQSLDPVAAGSVIGASVVLIGLLAARGAIAFLHWPLERRDR